MGWATCVSVEMQQGTRGALTIGETKKQGNDGPYNPLVRMCNVGDGKIYEKGDGPDL
jgi:hypothetical protein